MVASTGDTRARRQCHPDHELIEALREHTGGLHRQAERSGLIARLLAGSASIREYTLLLRNLLPVYQAMESQLEYLPARYPYTIIGEPKLFRSSSLIDDLESLCGPNWPVLPVTPAAREYAKRLEDPGMLNECRILGHAYTRYLGDLSGGRILQRVLHRRLGLGPDQTHFYEFKLPGGSGAFKGNFIDALNAIPGSRRHAIVDEAVTAFELNIRLSEELLSLG